MLSMFCLFKKKRKQKGSIYHIGSSRVNLNKSYGSDVVDVKYLRSAAVNIAPVLELLGNACLCLTLGIFSSCLKVSKTYSYIQKF